MIFFSIKYDLGKIWVHQNFTFFGIVSILHKKYLKISDYIFISEPITQTNEVTKHTRKAMQIASPTLKVATSPNDRVEMGQIGLSLVSKFLIL